jgi:SseB protein N-terminal domain
MPNRARPFITIPVALLFPACMKSEPNTPTSKDALIRRAVPPFIVVVLAQQPDPKSNILTLQDYHRDGRSFIPIFRSKESFQQSTRGGLNKPIYQIDRRLFISMLHGADTVILDVGLPDEIISGAEELKRIFPEPFDISSPTPNQ